MAWTKADFTFLTMYLPCTCSFHAGSFIHVLNTIAVRSPLVPLINTLERLFIGILVDTWSILNWHLGQESTNFPSMHTSRSTLGWLSTEHLSRFSQDVNQVSIEWPKTDWLFIVCWLRCWLTLVHNAFSTHDFSCIELCKIHVSCVRGHRRNCVIITVLLLLCMAALQVFVYVAIRYLSSWPGCPDKTTSFGSLG